MGVLAGKYVTLVYNCNEYQVRFYKVDFVFIRVSKKENLYISFKYSEGFCSPILLFVLSLHYDHGVLFQGKCSNERKHCDYGNIKICMKEEAVS